MDLVLKLPRALGGEDAKSYHEIWHFLMTFSAFQMTGPTLRLSLPSKSSICSTSVGVRREGEFDILSYCSSIWMHGHWCQLSLALDARVPNMVFGSFFESLVTSLVLELGVLIGTFFESGCLYHRIS